MGATFVLGGETVNLDERVAVSASGGVPYHTPGHTVRTSRDGEAIYLRFNVAIPKGRFVTIDDSQVATGSLGAGNFPQRRLGITHAEQPVGSWGWVWLKGTNIEMTNGASAIAAGGLPVFLAATRTGEVSNVTASADLVHGLNVPVSGIAASATATVQIAYPRVGYYSQGG